jgi:hypothetical protein
LQTAIGIRPLSSASRSLLRQARSGTKKSPRLVVASYVTAARPDVMARGILGMMAHDARAPLSLIDIPVLTVVGDRDTMTLPEAGQFITQSVPIGELTPLAPARQMGLLEHDRQFNPVVARFVDSCWAVSVAG